MHVYGLIDIFTKYVSFNIGGVRKIMIKKSHQRISSLALAGILSLLLAFSVQAKELPAGTVISAANYNKIKNDTFEGHKIADMMPSGRVTQILKYGLTMELEHSNPKNIAFPEIWKKAEQANAGKYSLNVEHKIAQKSYFTEGRGAPFPMNGISVKDPNAGWKLVWDYWFANPFAINNGGASGYEAVIKKDSGIVTKLRAVYISLRLQGLIGTKTPSVHLGNRSNGHAIFMLVLTYPYDLAGIGTYSRQYDNGQHSDNFIYLRSLRRTRRTANSRAWVDPQPQTDFLTDDANGLQGYPAWYKSWKLLGEKYILVSVTMPDPAYTAGPINGEFLDINNSPHWNAINTKWQPRKVFVLEGIPPDYHPYGKKILYADYEYPFFYFGQFYDKNMKLWKLWRPRYAPYWNGTCQGDGQPGLQIFGTTEIDLKADRATFIKPPFNFLNCNSIDINYVQPSILKDAASGALLTKIHNLKNNYKKLPTLPQYKAIKNAWLSSHN